MTRRQIVESNLTGHQVDDYVTVSVERVGYMIEFPDGNFTNRLTADVEPHRIAEMIAKVKFRKSEPILSRTGNFEVR